MIIYYFDENGNYTGSGESHTLAENSTELKPPSEEYTYDGNTWVLIDAVPVKITMRQARLALLQAGLLDAITSSIVESTDEEMKIEWEYATEIRRDWPSLISTTESLGVSKFDLDAMFIAASAL